MSTPAARPAAWCCWVTLLALGLTGAGHAAERFEPWPGARYDAAIPTLTQVVGHDFGADLTAPEALNRYLAALAQAAPDRTRLVTYAHSWQGRPLNYLVISAPEHIAALDSLRAGMQRLADPRGAADADLRALTGTLPAVVWLAHGVHGNEVSSSDAALLTAYHLLAGADDEVARLLKSLVVIIDPAQNPDGRARFLNHYRNLQGLEPQPSPIAAERVEPWPNGRTNHYLFDMNRDWFAQTQPEVRGRVAAFLDYFPLVHVDVHEMGTDTSYYFPPPAVPYNPYLTEPQHDLLAVFGRAMADRFDRFGFRYFTREVYDAYYPGYGDTWPALHGAAGMTFEMASARGLLGQRSDGTVVSYRDGVHRHFVASMATLEAAAEHRQRLLDEFLALRRPGNGDNAYVLLRDRDPGRTDKLADVLMRQGVEVRRLPDDARICGGLAPAGSYVVSVDQPAGRLAGTLLAPESPADAAFWAEQERRLARRLPVEVYDVVAWSLPQLFDVGVLSCSLTASRYPRVAELPPPPAAPAAGDATVAYLVPWGTQAAARFLAAALRDDVELAFTTRPFTQGTRRYPRGTLILRRADNAPDLARRIDALVAASGAEVIAAERSWIDSGVDFGSQHVRRLRPPGIAIAWGAPAAAASAGSLRFAVERKLGYPVTPVHMTDLGSPWLDQFQVLLLPDGGDYGKALPESAAANLARWVAAGGTLIGVGAALEYLGSEAVGLLDARVERQAASKGDDAGDADRDDGGDAGAEQDDRPAPGAIFSAEGDLDAAVAPVDARPPEIPGVLVNAVADADHWLTAGLPARLPVMLTGSRVFTPLRLDKGTNALRFAEPERLVAAGYLWQSVRPQIAFKPAVMVQTKARGQVIAFAVDPSFRGMMDGMDVLLANALLFGPAVAGPVPARP